MAYGNVNVSGPTQSEIEGVQQNIDDVKEVIGQTTNTGGTLTAGTVMAKLNKLLTDWTNVRAGKIDTINTNAAKLTDARVGYIDKLANFGATTDTGGTATTGTAMAKLNKLLIDWTTARAGKIDTINTNTSNLNTRLTSTRAGYLDKLANFGAVGDTGGTATAGTMMAKLNALITANSKGLKVKSVQHGYVAGATFNFVTAARGININQVNATKSILITDSGDVQPYTGGSNTRTFSPSLNTDGSGISQKGAMYNATSTKRTDFADFNWSVIEFE